jgi:hypothetical protein
MKKIVILSLISVLFLTILNACHKYEDGGYASKNRLKGKWNLDVVTTTYLDNDSVSTITFPYTLVPEDVPNLPIGMEIVVKSATIEFNKDGSGSFGIGISASPVPMENKFSWSLSDDKDYIKISFDSGLFSSFMPNIIPEKTKILKLTKKELRLSATDDTNVQTRLDLTKI